MSEFHNNDVTIYDWLNFFSAKSNHFVFRYWVKNKEIFFDSFMIMWDQEFFIICDKKTGDLYKFKKPDFIQLNLESVL